MVLSGITLHPRQDTGFAVGGRLCKQYAGARSVRIWAELTTPVTVFQVVVSLFSGQLILCPHDNVVLMIVFTVDYSVVSFT